MPALTPSKPLFFNRILKETVWGGHSLAGWLGEEMPFEGPLGESWELSDVDGSETIIAGGDFSGCTLHQLLREHSEAILGSAKPSASGNRFPLLIKFLEAEEDLSIQVHPSGNALGSDCLEKSECWYFLEATQEAEVLCGLNPGVTRERLSDAIRSESMPCLLKSHKVEPNTLLMVEAGQVHAIRPGTILCEIQQTSDTTFRLYDWNRLGLDGNLRDLHVTEGLDAIDFAVPAPSLVRPQFAPLLAEGIFTNSGNWKSALLVSAKPFQVKVFRGSGFCDFGPLDKPRVVTIVAGSGTIHFESEIKPLCQGATALIPAACPSYRLTGDPNMTVLEAIPC